MKGIFLILLFVAKTRSEVIVDENPRMRFFPCLGTNVVSEYQYEVPAGRQYVYKLIIPSGDQPFQGRMSYRLVFNSEAHAELAAGQNSVGDISGSGVPGYTTTHIYFKTDTYNITFLVFDMNTGIIPYLIELEINGVEHCERPLVSYLDKIVLNHMIAKEVKSSIPDQNCGRRKVPSDKLTTTGQMSKPEDWPWHVAIYRKDAADKNIICGGTLISKLFVVTAAHCATVNRIPVTPDILSVVLGKHSFDADYNVVGDIEVLSVIVHSDFGSPNTFDNDIALLKLKTEAVYSDYIQPACICSARIVQETSSYLTTGTVLSWGSRYKNNRVLSPELMQASLPIISDQKCIEQNKSFYEKMLRDKKRFCVVWNNETSSCKDDDGASFMVNVPDNSNSLGVWYIRGIVSPATPSTNVCNAQHYGLFTDVSKYEDWIRTKTFDKIFQIATFSNRRHFNVGTPH